MQEIVAIRHVAFEHLGVLGPFFSLNSWNIRYIDANEVSLSQLNPLEPDLLVVLGGPIGAYSDTDYPFLRRELNLIERRLHAEKPLLGICLGAQLMAKALGSAVYPGTAKEIGWHRISLTPDGEQSCLSELASCNYRVLHWHGDTFDLPEQCLRLASSPLTINQAFSYGKHALGLQFHLEVDAAEIEQWLIGHALEIAETPGVNPTDLRQDSAKYGGIVAVSGIRCISKWLGIQYTPKLKLLEF